MCFFAVDTFPALSTVYAVIVLIPFVLIVTLVVPVAVSVCSTACAPVILYLNLFAPLSSSLPAIIVTVTFDLYHPLAPAVPDKLIVGAFGSFLSIILTLA